MFDAIDDIDKLCKFHKNLITNAYCITVSRKEENNTYFQPKIATFPLLVVQSFFFQNQ